MSVYHKSGDSSSIFYFPRKISGVTVSKEIRETVDKFLNADPTWNSTFARDLKSSLSERISVILALGPFVTDAQLGPKYYIGTPAEYRIPVSRDLELSALGWKPQQRKASIGLNDFQKIIVCGTCIDSGAGGLVYYLLAEEGGGDFSSGVSHHQKAGDEVYVCSLQRFFESLRNVNSFEKIERTEKSLTHAEYVENQLAQARISAAKVRAVIEARKNSAKNNFF